MARRVLLAIPFCREILRGIARYMHAHEAWHVDLAPDWALGVNPKEMANWPGDGLIAQLVKRPAAELLLPLGKPIVCVSDALDQWPFPTVHSDNMAIGKKGADYYLARAFKSLLFVGIAGAAYSQQRGDGFERAAREAGLLCRRIDLDPDTEIQRPLGVARLDEVLGKMSRPIGVMAANDGTAQFIEDACLNRGLLIPDQVSILGVDNDDVGCELKPVPLSSVQPGSEQIGHEAARVLDAMMRGQVSPPSPILVPPVTIVTRRSTDIIASPDVEVSRALRIMHQRARSRFSVKQLVAEMSCSRRFLERRFQQALGRSPFDVLLSIQLEHAMELLRTTDMPIPAIARAAGFTDLNHLGRCFRRKLRSSPGAYRKQFRSRELVAS